LGEGRERRGTFAKKGSAGGVGRFRPSSEKEAKLYRKKKNSCDKKEGNGAREKAYSLGVYLELQSRGERIKIVRSKRRRKKN